MPPTSTTLNSVITDDAIKRLDLPGVNTFRAVASKTWPSIRPSNQSPSSQTRCATVRVAATSCWTRSWAAARRFLLRNGSADVPRPRDRSALRRRAFDVGRLSPSATPSWRQAARRSTRSRQPGGTSTEAEMRSRKNRNIPRVRRMALASRTMSAMENRKRAHLEAGQSGNPKAVPKVRKMNHDPARKFPAQDREPIRARNQENHDP